MKFRLLLTIIIILPLSLMGQKQYWFNKLSQTDSAYIKNYYDEVSVKFLLTAEGSGFTIHPSTAPLPVKYYVNNDIKNGFEVHYQWWGIGLTVNNPFAGSDNWQKGSSSIFDLRIKAYGNALATEITIQDQRGFYLSNAKDIVSGWNQEKVYPQRPDLKIFTIGIIGYYIANFKEHSFRAAYIQNERQLKSAGSFVYSPSFVFNNVRSNYSLIPDQFQEDYNVEINEQVKAGKFFTFGFSAGYSYTHVFRKHFYVNLSFIPGIFLQSYDYKTNNGGIKGMDPTFLWLGRSSIGYNNDKIFFGLGGVWGFKNTKLDIGQSNFNYDMNQIRIWFGTRFNAPKINKRVVR